VLLDLMHRIDPTSRVFVLEPLRELAPDLVHPRLGETIAALARRVHDASAVRRREKEAVWPSSPSASHP
jgi:7,8-dihydro-6-hydroxymethylpterin-pyrophosphokinase